jgi:hypothetical protein
MGIDLFGIHETTSLTFFQLSFTDIKGGLKGEHRTFWLIFLNARFLAAYRPELPESPEVWVKGQSSEVARG